MIKAFQKLLAEKRNEVMDLKERYGNGYKCLITTEESVSVMQEELIALQPQLVETAAQVAEKSAVVDKEFNAAEVIRVAVSKEEAVA